MSADFRLIRCQDREPSSLSPSRRADGGVQTIAKMILLRPMSGSSIQDFLYSSCVPHLANNSPKWSLRQRLIASNGCAFCATQKKNQMDSHSMMTPEEQARLRELSKLIAQEN